MIVRQEGVSLHRSHEGDLVRNALALAIAKDRQRDRAQQKPTKPHPFLESLADKILRRLALVGKLWNRSRYSGHLC